MQRNGTMKTLQQRIRLRVLETQEQNTDHLPQWLRNIVRVISGGDAWTAQFVRGIIWQYRWLTLAAIVASLCAGLAEAATLGVLTLAFNYMTAMLAGTSYSPTGTINSIITQISQLLGGQEPFLVLIVLAVIFQVSRSSFEFLSQASAIYLRVWLEGNLQRRIFTQIVGTRYQEIASSRLGNLTSYNAQVGEVGSMVQGLSNTLIEFTIIFAYVSVLFWISWQFTFVATIGLILLSFALRNIRQNISQSVSRFLSVSVRLNERIIEYLQGLRLVHIFVREEMVIDEINTLINTGIRTRRIGLLHGASIVPIFQSITITGIAIFLGIGFWILSESNMTVAGEMLTYVFVLYRVVPRLVNLNHQLGQIATQWPFVARTAHLLNPVETELEYLPGQAIEQLKTGVEFKNVSLRYPEGERNAISDLTFQIPAGKMLAFVGTSGAGKSSIINLLLGMYRPTAGRILIDGVDLQQCDLASWRRLIGVVDQDTMVFSGSVAENIRFGKIDASEEEVTAAAKIASADSFIQEMPQGYETEIGDRGYRLSGGQRQRLAIARAIINQPALLLFDEATSSLDSQSERLIQQSLEELRQERTVVIIAHRLSTIIKADQIIVLDNGQIVEQGNHQELLAQHGRYAAMWKLQVDHA